MAVASASSCRTASPARRRAGKAVKNASFQVRVVGLGNDMLLQVMWGVAWWSSRTKNPPLSIMWSLRSIFICSLYLQSQRKQKTYSITKKLYQYWFKSLKVYKYTREKGLHWKSCKTWKAWKVRKSSRSSKSLKIGQAWKAWKAWKAGKAWKVFF